MSETPLPAPAESPPEAVQLRRDQVGRRRLVILGGVFAVVVVGLGVWRLLTHGEVSTDNAIVDADVVAVTAQVGGQVARVVVADNATVKAGDPLVVLDTVELDARLRQAAGELAAAFLEPRKQIKHALHVRPDLVVLTDESAHLQVLGDGHAREDAASLGHHHQALARQIPRALVTNEHAIEPDVTRPRRQQSGEGLERGGLASAVGSDQAHELARMHLEADARDGSDRTVVDFEITHRQRRGHRLRWGDVGCVGGRGHALARQTATWAEPR